MNKLRPRLLLIRVGTLAVILCGLWGSLRLVSFPPLVDPSLSSRALFDREGKLLGLSLTADDKYRLHTPYHQFSKSIVKATIAYEDQHFYRHPGINLYSLARGLVATVFNPSRPIGGSTLTMQLARLRFKLQTRTVFGKLQQIYLALCLEQFFSKEEILEGYLNLAPYGANIEGVGAASLIYFRKPVDQLSLDEAVTLAVLPQSPSRRPLLSGRDDLDFARGILGARLESSTGKRIVPRDQLFRAYDVPNVAPHLFLRVRAGEPHRIVYRSELDATLQTDAEGVLDESIKRFSEFGVANGTVLIAQLPDLAVRAYVGSARYVDPSIAGFVNGLSAPRSPGSLLKPFIYGLALDQGVIVPETMLTDLPLRLASYTPENFERNFLGPLSATDALVKSRNIPALELFRALEPGSFYQFLHRGAVQRLQSEDHYGIALVLGGLGVTAEEVAQLYGVLGDGGRLQKLKLLQGAELSPLGTPKEHLLSEEAAFLVRDMLSKNPPALSRSMSGVRFREWSVPWKTGTSYGSKDAWAAGLVGDYVIVVWLGNFDGRANANLVGRDFAGPVFFSLVDRLIAHGVSVPRLLPGSLNLKRVEVCALSGALPNADCPHRKQSWFIPGVSPISRCTLHQKIEVDSKTGARLCHGEVGGEERVYEVWDSSMQRLFAQAGMRRNVPPAFSERCELAANSDRGIRILSPEEHIEYRLERHRPLEIEFVASAPGDSRTLTWFVDDVPLGQSSPSQSMHWVAKVGKFVVRATDDRGRSSLIRIRVVPQLG